MTHFERDTALDADPADATETARRMARALEYLMRVSAAAGLSRVTAKLAVAQAEALIASGQTLIDVDSGKRRHDGLQHDGSRRSH